MMKVPFLTGAVCLLALGAAVAFGVSTPAQADTALNLCVQKNGNVRVLQSGETSCKKDETLYPLQLSGGGPKVVDRYGAVVGSLEGVNLVLVTSGTNSAIVNIRTTGFPGGIALFSSSNCTGTAYSDIDPTWVPAVAEVVGTTAYIASGIPQNIQIQSYSIGNPSTCVSGSWWGSYAPASTIDLSGFHPPFSVQ